MLRLILTASLVSQNPCGSSLNAAAYTAAPPSPTVKGAAQSSGDAGKIGATYALGDGDGACRFTLRKLKFVATRMVMNGKTVFPNADQKFLVVDYSVVNPNKSAEFHVDAATFPMTAVDALGQGHEPDGTAENKLTSQVLDIDLEPGRGVEGRVYMVVPAALQVPRLVLNYGKSRTIRYDLRGSVTPVEPIVADPADKSGARARAVISDARIGVTYPTGRFDLTLESVAFTDLPIGGKAPDEDKRYFVATIRAKNALTAADGDVDIANSGGAAFSVLTPGGDKIDWSGDYWKTTSEDKADTAIPTGFEKHFRLYFQVPKSGSLKSLTLSEGDSYRKLVYDLSAVHRTLANGDFQFARWR